MAGTSGDAKPLEAVLRRAAETLDAAEKALEVAPVPVALGEDDVSREWQRAAQNQSVVYILASISGLGASTAALITHTAPIENGALVDHLGLAGNITCIGYSCKTLVEHTVHLSALGENVAKLRPVVEEVVQSNRKLLTVRPGGVLCTAGFMALELCFLLPSLSCHGG